MMNSLAESALSKTQWRGFFDSSPSNAGNNGDGGERERLLAQLSDFDDDDFDDDFFDTPFANHRPPPPPPPRPASPPSALFADRRESATLRFSQSATRKNSDHIAIDVEERDDDDDNGDGDGANACGTSKSLYVQNAGQLDAFLQSVYSYYLHGGMGAFMLAKLTDLLKLVFVASLFYFVGAWLNFAALLDALQRTRAGADTHQHIRLASYVEYRGLPFWCYPLAIVFGVYIVAMLLRSAFEVHRMFSVRDFYHFELKLFRVHSLRWSEVVQRILESQEMQAVGIGTSPLHVVARLMRQSNYFVALISTDSLAIPKSEQTALTGPWAGLFSHSCAKERDKATLHPTMTQTLEWALQRTLFSFAFPHSVELRPELRTLVERYQARRSGVGQQFFKYTSGATTHSDIEQSDEWEALVSTLSNRFRTMAVLGIIFSPFVLCFLLVDFLLECGQQWRRSQPHTILATRNWSTEARWMFREYNELPHYFRRRLARAHDPADKFISVFAKPKTAIVARFLAYCLGAIMCLLICFGLVYDDDALTRVDIVVGRSAIWWIGVLGALIAFLRAYVPGENAVFEPRKHLRRTAAHIHFMPRAWIDKEHTSAVRRDFSRFFQYRWTTTACELLSVVFTPYLLWSVLPRRTDALLRFIVENTHRDEALGDVCRYSLFRVDVDGDDLYGGRYKTRDREPLDPDHYYDQQGKLETSFVNFIGEYPEFRPDVHNSMFIESVKPRRQQQQQPEQQQNQPRERGAAVEDAVRSQDDNDRDDEKEQRMDEVISQLLLSARSTENR